MNDRRRHIGIQILAGIYAVCMLFLLFFRKQSTSSLPYTAFLLKRLNLIPFTTIRRYAKYIFAVSRPSLMRRARINLFGNILLFFPLGLFPPLLWKSMQRFYRTFLLCTGIMILMEVLQLVLLVGWCDIDDLILNLTGASIGYAIYHFTSQHQKNCDG